MDLEPQRLVAANMLKSIDQLDTMLDEEEEKTLSKESRPGELDSVIILDSNAIRNSALESGFGYNRNSLMQSGFGRLVRSYGQQRSNGGTNGQQNMESSFLQSDVFHTTVFDSRMFQFSRPRGIAGSTILDTFSPEVLGFEHGMRVQFKMGPSGSGKSTLLEVLAGRKKDGRMQGSILFAGNIPTSAFLRRYTGFVEQFDTLIEGLTVHEMLMYTAELKSPLEDSLQALYERVEEVSHQLDLGACRDAFIGDGLSRGQRRRVNIGLALVTSPRVLFLDEPTEGLGSYAANEVMAAVAGLQMTKVCATSSPTPFCYDLFQTLVLLLHGRIVYCGVNGDPVIRYFENAFPDVARLGQTGSYQTQSEWVVDLITKAGRDGQHEQLRQAYEGGAVAQATRKELDRGFAGEEVVPEPVLEQLRVQHATVVPYGFGVRTLLKYRMLRRLEDPRFLGARLGDKLIFSLLVMAIFWRVGANPAPTNINNMAAVLFIWMVLPAYTAVLYLPSVLRERPLFFRNRLSLQSVERGEGLYRAATYLTYKFLEELLLIIPCSAAFAAVVFFPLKLSGSFVLFWHMYLLTSLNSLALGYLVAALSPCTTVAHAVLSLYVTLLLFFAGPLLRPADQPPWVHWFSYIDWLHYAWSSVMINQFENSDAVSLDNVPVLEYYSMARSDKWEQLGYVAIFFVVFTVLAWLALAFRQPQRQRWRS